MKSYPHRSHLLAPASIILLAMLGFHQSALADDMDALLLADTASKKVETASDWQWYAEAAVGQSTTRNSSAAASNQRLSFDVRFDKSFARGWRAVMADRLDVNWPAQTGNQHSINTLKEAYLSWQAQENRDIDLGRINARYGVATGYNPTDFFRAGAIRSVVSVDPGSLKKNRLGSVMLRGQTLWDDGSLTALYSPKLADKSNDAAFSPDFGATNNQNRWMLSLSQKLTENLNPQWLIYSESHQSPQLGFNFTTLLNNASVAFIEWSGGRSRSQLSQSLNSAGDSAFYNRIATGVTYTARNKLSVTLEYDYNGAALDKTEWNALTQGSPAVYGQYRKWVQSTQDLPTKQAVFLYASWQDAIISHLDLSAMVRFNVADHSRLNWLEARHHWDQVDLAMQWQINRGSPSSQFGAAAQQRAWQASLRYYF